MEYTNIISLVPEGEHFDVAAVNEGVWLSQGHLDSIEASLAGNESAVAAITAQRDEQALLAQQAAVTIEEQQRVNEGYVQTIDGLNAQIADLKKGPAADVQNTSKDADEVGANKPVPSYLSENNPINQFADKRLKRTSATR